MVCSATFDCTAMVRDRRVQGESCRFELALHEVDRDRDHFAVAASIELDARQVERAIFHAFNRCEHHPRAMTLHVGQQSIGGSSIG
jgi:hypothetical protein